LWHQEGGWSAAIEAHSGEDLIVLEHLGDDVPGVLELRNPPDPCSRRELPDLTTEQSHRASTAKAASASE
jgi:hypothetical protein